MRVAYTIEHLWGRVPGGTGVATRELATELTAQNVDLVGVSGTHDHPPSDDWSWDRPMVTLSGHGARLYASWVWARSPSIDKAFSRSGHQPADVVHATGLIPCPTKRPLVVTVHDLAFLRMPEAFTRWGRTLFAQSLRVIRSKADLVLCASQATLDDCERAGISADRLRHVPLGVRPIAVDPALLPSDLPERFALFVGTLEPRKNLHRLVEAISRLDTPLPLVVVGERGWGDNAAAAQYDTNAEVHFLGFQPSAVLAALYDRCTVFCYPSLWEGFGLPAAEAMAYGAPVVTSHGTSCAEVVGSAAVLVDPRNVDDIARGIAEALIDADTLAARGRARAGELTWSAAARLTADAYREVAR